MIAVAWAATRVGRPLRWAETRSENLVAMTHGRAQWQRIRIGGTRDGRILAYRLDLVQDAGAYPRGAAELAYLTRLMASGAYQIPRVECAYQVVVTSTTPIFAYRGAGRPEATAAIERAVDLLAGRDRHGPGRGAPGEHGPRRPFPVHLADRGGVRHRRLRGGPGQGARGGRIRRAQEGPGRQARAR